MRPAEVSPNNGGVVTVEAGPTRSIATDAAYYARALADGAAVAHPFGNVYGITSRADAETVQRVNVMKGRPPEQIGSITGPPSVVFDVWDFSSLPSGLSPRAVLQLVDAFLEMGPFGFRGPAASQVPRHLTCPDGDMSTAQVISPGFACPSNDFLDRCLEATGEKLLYVTSANRSRHLTGADDSPAHWLASGLRSDFGGEANLLVVEHADELVARRRYPRHLPMSTTVLAVHRLMHVPGERRPSLVLERHGSLHEDDVRAVLDSFGFGLVRGPKAHNRLQQRDYPQMT